MLSIQFIREHADDVREALRKRHTDAPIDAILDLDARRRALQSEVDRLRADQNAAGRAIGATKDAAERQTLIAAQKAGSERIKMIEPELRALGEQLQQALYQVPNMPLPEVPEGDDETGNVVVKIGPPAPDMDFVPQPHWEIGERLGIIDFERGVKIAGSRFFVLKGLGAQLQRALINFMLDLHIHEHGLTVIEPPYVVTAAGLWATGDFPKFMDNVYHDAEDDLWLVPTAEVPLTNLHRDEIIEPGVLPLRYVAHTPCWRREKMSAGRDVRGIKRVHQFHKVEMYTFCEPERSMGELERMLFQAETVCERLGLPYRRLQICTGDLGFKSAISFDLEAYAPGQAEWLEISSISNVRDFQARRAEIRFRREAGGRAEHPHMLNGSGLALPRVIIAILENYQNADGSVTIPDALRPYMRADRITAGGKD